MQVRVLAFVSLSALGVALSGLVGCRQDAPPLDPVGSRQVWVDLAADADIAEPLVERLRMRLADPAVRPQLGSGWSFVEGDAAGPYRWAIDGAASVEFFAAASRRLDLEARCTPFDFADASPQQLTPVINGQPLATVDMEASRSVYRWSLDQEQVVAGGNLLELRFARHDRPVDVLEDAVDVRSLSASCHSLALLDHAGEEPPSEEPESAAADGHVLRLPVSHGLRYDFRLETAARLVIPRAEGAAGTVLEVRWSDRTGTLTSWSRPADGGAVELELPAPVGGAGRLEVWARHQRRSWLASLFSGTGARAAQLTMPVVTVASDSAPESAAATEAAPVQTPAPAPVQMSVSPPKPDMLVYLIDTLRADHLGVYGYDRPTSPNLDAFAEDAVVFTEARAQSSWTRTSVVSIFTGLLPQTHGVHQRSDALPAQVETLAETLSGAGYRTAGVVTNGNVGPSFALGQGFDAYQWLRESRQRPAMHRLADWVNDWLFTWLTTVEDKPDRPPYFLYAHTTDPHSPYWPPEPFRQRLAPDVDPQLGSLEAVAELHRQGQAAEARREPLIALYDAEIASNDHHFGLLVEHLEAHGWYDDMVIVVLSDHGEEFLDHGGWEHGKTLYEEQLQVPLLIKLPGNRHGGRRLDVSARHVDILPTLLELAGVEPNAPVDGRSLLAELENPADQQPPDIAHLALEGRQQASFVRRGLKLIDQPKLAPRQQLFDLERDPAESDDLSADPNREIERGVLNQELRRALRDLESHRQGTIEIEIDPELKKELEALGYV